MTHEYLTDDELLATIGSAIDEADTVPAAVIDAAKAGYTWRTVDAELAELVFDSAFDELVGVRGADEATRQVTFRAPGVEIEVAVLSGGARRIIGQLVPPQQAEVQLRFGSESRSVESDHLGRFTFHDVPAGPVSLRCVYGEGGASVVQTDWMLL